MVHPCSLRHGVITPGRGGLHPAARAKRLPERGGIRLPQVAPALEQSRFTGRHLSAVVDEDPGVTLPGPLISVKASDPIALTIGEPTLCHAKQNSTLVLLAKSGRTVQALPTDHSIHPMPFTPCHAPHAIHIVEDAIDDAGSTPTEHESKEQR